MDKQFNMEKLFNEKLQNFEQETTPDFDKAMERKIDHLHWPKMLRWFIGLVLIAGLALVIPFTLDSSDSQETQTTIETEPPSLASSQKELEEDVQQEKQITDIKNGQIPKSRTLSQSLSSPKYTKGAEMVESLDEEKSSKETIPTKTKSINNLVSPDKQQMIVEQKNAISNNTASPDQIENQLAINMLSWNKPPIQFDEKQKLYPTSLLDEGYLAKEKAKNRKLKEKELKQEEKQALKKQRELEKEKQKAAHMQDKKLKKELKKSEKSTPKFNNRKKVDQSKKKTKKKKAKFKKNRVPGIYEGAIELSVSPIFIKNLSPPLEPENDTVTNWLTNKEFKTSYDFGLEFMFKQKESNWLVKTGLHYQKLSEEVNYYFLREYMDEELSHWVYDSIFEYHIDPPNFDTILVGVDSSFYEHWERNETSQKYANQYQYLNIPILLGYHIDLRKPTTDPDFKKGFDLHVLTGTGIGILLKNKGYHYNADGYIYSYPGSQETTIDWYLHAQLAMNYHWKNISLFVKPKLQFQMRKRSFDEYFENRHYLMYGVDFGVRINILLRRTPKRDKLSTKHI